MSSTNYKELTPPVRKEVPDMIFVDELGDQVSVSVVHLDENSNIVSLEDLEGQMLPPEDISLEKNLLYVPGIGHLYPQSRIVYKGKDYILLFGWHTNISNQTICSWYLESLDEDIPHKTLYKEMIKEIELVHFR